MVDIAKHRATAVIVGVVWAAIVSRWWWPIEARRELGKALGEYVSQSFTHLDSSLNQSLRRFCLNMGWLYTRLVAFNSWDNSAPSIGQVLPSEPTETTLLLAGSSHLNESIAEFMAMYAFRVLAR